MSRRGQSSETRTAPLENSALEVTVGHELSPVTAWGSQIRRSFYHRNVTAVAMPSSSNHAQSLIRIGSSWTTQPHYKYFYWLDALVEENIEDAGCDRNDIFMARKLKELQQRVMKMDLELNLRVKNDVRGSS
ncbi:hypothetical protein PIB30_074155 [Stylosanthes scabra]|uniref:Uncharacterized protein n=1 Tax=Stylosanthes scabra TaxID=79078 RepID=A0ABU6UNF7_9FABA|nr:hypothetical protein [Stylosanthes scabra]